MSKPIMGSGVHPRPQSYVDFLTFMAKAAGVDEKPWKKITCEVGTGTHPTFTVEMLGNDEDIPAALEHAKKGE